ncbi:hypothetical protein E3E12_06230 [Formicincola oecophyllae]|uniref:SPOR domain-containing protein n=1 Tax=Formicincola oecophyllae TaxID=2558361 RepID=A0A4Y6UBS3_9PROT|nr:SPOR domain-containing protein [Formicincola oecophyllae]QDH13851.1 hypothetical protein E3E12_06230 [Formicincola oecophyllae]
MSAPTGHGPQGQAHQLAGAARRPAPHHPNQPLPDQERWDEEGLAAFFPPTRWQRFKRGCAALLGSGAQGGVEKAQRRSAWGMGLVAVGTLVVGAGAWRYQSGAAGGTPIIAPPDIALKTRPADPGGMQLMADEGGEDTGGVPEHVHVQEAPEEPDQALLNPPPPPQATVPAAGQGGVKLAANGAPIPAPTPANDAVAAAQGAAGSASGRVQVASATAAPRTPGTIFADPAPERTIHDDRPVGDLSQGMAQAVDQAPAAAEEAENAGGAPADTAPDGPDDAAPSQDDQARAEAERQARAERAAQAREQARQARAEAARQAREARERAAQAAQATAAAKSASVPATGHVTVQLAALGSMEDARATWRRYQQRFPALAGHEPRYQTTTRGGRQFVRLRTGGFSKEGARQFCASVTARHMTCAVANF